MLPDPFSHGSKICFRDRKIASKKKKLLPLMENCFQIRFLLRSNFGQFCGSISLQFLVILVFRATEALCEAGRLQS